MGIFRKFAALLFILAIPVALVTTNIRFLANEPHVYLYAIDQFDGPRTTGIDRDQLLSAGGELRAYFNDNEDTVRIQVQQDGKDVSLFNSRETSHLKDVKSRFRLMNRVEELSILYALTYMAFVVLWAREVSLRALAVQFAAGSFITLAAVGATAAFSFSGFDAAWTDFHELIFRGNDFWQLNPLTDHLIQMFPPEFWQNIVFLCGLLIASEAALILILAGIYLGVTSRQSSAQRLTPYYA